MVDEYFEYFLAEFPLSWRGAICTSEHERIYSGLLPEALISYWNEYGFSGFGAGRVWLVDPLEWRQITEILLDGIRHPQLPKDARYIPIVRSAFGEIWFWTPDFGISITLNPVLGTVFFGTKSQNVDDKTIQAFFVGADNERFDIEDNDGIGLFDRVLERVGKLQADEIYGFVPAAIYGGALAPENVSVFPIIAHLVLLREFMGNNQQSV
ncbi:GAD-like domain-containing protein [Mycobacteroides salmoniphilum]|uniref:GAD-like domain protein n=1 Tax=Mycobacteroides salmoniphilum TaxID=404941 RepID=A0A4R8SZH8_9MYCO|nr:GAD-like domain-containing protein [Mycobacteroides salmoniphilum]TEA08734.1 GAD-like domain protein [Mycobacteroides salmoniphilum]